MGWLDDFRKRNELATERLARHPFLAWLGHALTFTAVSVVLQAMRSGPVDVVRALVLGAVVATAVVGGTLVGHRMRRSRER